MQLSITPTHRMQPVEKFTILEWDPLDHEMVQDLQLVQASSWILLMMLVTQQVLMGIPTEVKQI